MLDRLGSDRESIKAGLKLENVLSLESTRERYTTSYLVINQTNHANSQPVVECPRVKQPSIKSAVEPIKVERVF